VAVEDARLKDNSIPKVGIHLISLTGGDFPKRSSYAFDDALEPIRALMSGREARAYIALNRAQATLVDATRSNSVSFDRTDLRSIFYRLPLGWSISQRTGNIIAHESGRYWDCEPGQNYVQARPALSNSDCIQLRVNFLIEGSLDAALADLKTAEEYKKVFSSAPDSKPKLDHEALLDCYEQWLDEQQETESEAKFQAVARLRLITSLSYQHQFLSYYQAEYVRELLREWDSLNEKNPNFLAYVLASLSLDTSEFRRVAELLSFDSEPSLNAIWGPVLDKTDAANKLKAPPIAPIDRTALLNNPKALASVVWRNRFKNKNDEDAWNYRGRGLFQIYGREQYALLSKWIGYDLISHPDAVWNRRASARVAFAHYLNASNSQSHKKLADFVDTDQPDWKGARLNDPDADKTRLNQIAARAEMFVGCMQKAGMNK
jgi:predicted chitinase